MPSEAPSTIPLPLIDFTPFLPSPTESPTKPQTATRILSAFHTHGLLYLTHHGLSGPLLSKTFTLSQRFFAHPVTAKQSLSWTTPAANRGWSAPGREKLDLMAGIGGGVDLKESFEIGREGVVGLENQWPTKGFSSEGEGVWEEEFRATMLEFYAECRGLFARVMRAVAVGLGLQEDWFDGFLTGGDCTLRLLYYPAVEGEQGDGGLGEKEDKEVTVRAGAHTDYGAITLLFQDSHPGLQVLSPNGETFFDALPVADAVVVNAGDLLARWSNDKIKSTVHRVVSTTKTASLSGGSKAAAGEARYSIAFFCNPDFDRWIEAIPGTYDEGEQGRGKKYKGIYSNTFTLQKYRIVLYCLCDICEERPSAPSEANAADTAARLAALRSGEYLEQRLTATY